MKKTLAFLLLAILSLLLCLPASAEEITVYVTVVDGTPMLAYRSVTVTDADGDGTLTISDALACAHETYFPDGASGYGTAMTEFGISMTKLWGKDNSGGYGYYHNDEAPMSLADKVSDGDRVTAFCYRDMKFYSDTYAFFDKYEVKGKEIALTLCTAGYDADWNPVTAPAAGMSILVDGKPSGFVTGEDGKVTLTLDGKAHEITAEKEGTYLVTPYCRVLAAENPATGDCFVIVAMLAAAFALTAFAAGKKICSRS